MTDRIDLANGRILFNGKWMSLQDLSMNVLFKLDTGSCDITPEAHAMDALGSALTDSVDWY